MLELTHSFDEWATLSSFDEKLPIVPILKWLIHWINGWCCRGSGSTGGGYLPPSKLACLSNVVTAWLIRAGSLLIFSTVYLMLSLLDSPMAGRLLMCSQVYPTLSLPQLMEGCWWWVAMGEPRGFYRSQARWVVLKVWSAITLEPGGLGDSCLLWLVGGLLGHVLECFEERYKSMKSCCPFIEPTHSFIWWMRHLHVHLMKSCFDEKPHIHK